MRILRWSWLEAALPLLLVTMRAAWIWPWLTLLHSWLSPTQQSPVWPLAVLVGLPFLSYGLTRGLIPAGKPSTQGKQLWARRLAIAASGLLVIALLLWWYFYRAIPPWQVTWLMTLGSRFTHWGVELPVEVLAAVTAVSLWLRGVLDAQAPLYHDRIWRSFGIGTLALALAILLGETTDAATLSALRWILLFFASGMGALALINLRMASGWSLFGRTPGRVRGDRYWLLSIVVTIGGLLLLGTLVGWLISPEDVAWLLDGLGLLLALLRQLLYWIVVVASGVLFAVGYGLYWLLRPLLRWLWSGNETEPMLQLPEPRVTPEPLTTEATDLAAVPEPFRWIALAVVVLTVFVVFVLVLRRLRAESEAEIDEVRTSIYSRDLLRDQLAELWQRLRAGMDGSAGSPVYFDLRGEEEIRRAIRAVYQRLLAWAAARGLPRSAAQTPLEYQRALCHDLPSIREPVTIITEGYLAARYGRDPLPAQTAEAVQAAWVRIEAQAGDEDERSEPRQS